MRTNLVGETHYMEKETMGALLFYIYHTIYVTIMETGPLKPDEAVLKHAVFVL